MNSDRAMSSSAKKRHVFLRHQNGVSPSRVPTPFDPGTRKSDCRAPERVLPNRRKLAIPRESPANLHFAYRVVFRPFGRVICHWGIRVRRPVLVLCLSLLFRLSAAGADRLIPQLENDRTKQPLHLFVYDATGSAHGDEIGSATDDAGLRKGTLQEVLRTPLVTGSGAPVTVAVLLSGRLPRILLPPTTDRIRIERFLAELSPEDSGGNNLESTFGLSDFGGQYQVTDVTFLSDGLLSDRGRSSALVVRDLPTQASEISRNLEGARWSAFLIDTSPGRGVASRTEAEWKALTQSRVYSVSTSSDVAPAVGRFLSALSIRRVLHSGPDRKGREPPHFGLGLPLATLAILGLLLSRSRRSLRVPRAFVIVRNGKTTTQHRTSRFGKKVVTVGAGGDISIPGVPGTVLTFRTRQERDRRGRIRHVTTVSRGDSTSSVGTSSLHFQFDATEVEIKGGF